jgi:hypothetical protein
MLDKNYTSLLSDIQQCLSIAENHVLHGNMKKIKQNHEELAVTEFANMEKERNLSKTRRKNEKRKRKN